MGEVGVLAALDAEGVATADLTVAFTDLEGFTGYTATSGDAAAGRLLLAHHRESGPIVRGRGGQVIKRLGDGLMLTIPAPEAAVLACLELAAAAPLPLRAGIHRGTVLLADGDVIGHVVNVAARLTASASAGEVVVTDEVRTASTEMRSVVFDGPFSRCFKGIAGDVAVYPVARCP